jgi:hypothetical protein
MMKFEQELWFEFNQFAGQEFFWDFLEAIENWLETEIELTLLRE